MKEFFLILMLGIFGIFQASGQLKLLLTEPNQNSANISINQPIIFHFNQSVDAIGAIDGFSVISNLRGKLSGSVTVSNSKVTITPSESFLYGEVISVTALPSVQSVTGVLLGSPQTVQFFTELKPSPRKPPSFMPKDIISSSGIITMVGASDMDGDKDLDIFAFYGSDIIWLENDGEEKFSKHTVKTDISFPYSVRAFDIDQDGDMDLIASAHYGGLMIFENDGSQHFNQTYSINEFSITSFDIADFDGDGQFDLVYSSLDGTSGYASSTYILYNRGSVSFEKVRINSSGFYKFMCVDLDNDLDIDIVHYNDSGVYYSLNDNGNFGLTLIFQEPNTTYETVLIADVNGNKRQDIILLKYHFSSPSLTVLLNEEQLQFTATQIGTNVGLLCSTGDYDGDGDQDIMTLDDNYTYSLLMNSGSMLFETRKVSPPLSGLYYPANSVSTDFDDDGDMDFLACPNSTIKLYKNSIKPFEEKSLPQITTVFGDADWGDYDNDGDLDLLATGDGVSRVYENQNGELSGQTFDLIGLWVSSCDWGDYDNDGDLDILLSGSSKVEWNDRGPVSIIYKNNNGGFEPLSVNPELPKIWYGEARWADLNNDGLLDIVFNGADYAGIYGGDGSGNFLKKVDFAFSALWANVDFGDFDNDADLDIAFSGYTGNALATVFRNDSNWKFTAISGNFAGRFGGNVSWSDMDNDGALDLVISGMQRNENGNTAPAITVYRNVGSSFSLIENNEFIYQGDENGTTVPGDYNNDGVADLLATTQGGSSFNPEMNLFVNTGSGDLKSSGISLPNVSLHSVNWIDIDQDHDLDIFANSRLLINNIQNANTRPEPPSKISVDSVYDNSVYFHWTAGHDAETATPGLSYQIYAGTKSHTQNVVNSNSNINSGLRKIVALGNSKGTNARIENLTGGDYFFATQTIDASFEGSMFSGEGHSFVIGIHGSRGGCLNTEYTYTAKPSGNYNWQISGGVILSGQGSDSITVSWNALGKGYISVSDTQGNINKLPIYIEVTPDPVINGDITVCVGSQTYLNNDAASRYSSWTVTGDNSISRESANNVTVNWGSSGEFDVIVRSFPEHKGCVAYDTITVSVDPKPMALIDGLSSVCINQVQEYSAASNNTEWSVINGVWQVASPTSINVKWPSQIGNGWVKLKEGSARSYCFSKDSLEIVVNNRPPKPFLSLLYDTIIVSSQSPNGIYSWYFNDQIVVQGSYIGIVPGISGTITVEVFNSEGCGNMSDDYIYYLPEDINQITVFPNPANEFVALEWTSKHFDDLEVFIYSSTNTLVKKFTVKKPWATIIERLDISGLMPGVYFIKLKDQKRVYTSKFIKR